MFTAYVRIAFASMVLLVGMAFGANAPKLQGRVNDYAEVLQPDAKEELESSLARYEKETTHQIVILTVPSLRGEPIEAFSLRVFNAWGLGRKGIDNGVLVTLAPTDHRARIELGTGMNQYISDSDADAIMNQVMVPAFREHRHDVGLKKGIERLFEVCRAYKVPH